MKQVMGLIAAFMLVAGTRLLVKDGATGFGEASMALGFVLIISYVMGKAAARFGLPSITGYLMVGMIFGPHLLASVNPIFAILDQKAISTLQLLDSLALGLIALSAGGELKWEAILGHGKRIFGVLMGQVLFVLIGIVLVIYFFRGWFPLLANLEDAHLLAAALLFAATALANSPSTALAIIQECNAKGPVSEVVLIVTVVKDAVVISLFTILLSIALLLVGDTGQEEGLFLWKLAWEVMGSILAGLALGWLVASFMKRVHRDAPLVVLAVAFAAMTLLPQWHLSGLLTCMVAGFYIENFSPHGEDLIKAVERHAMPIYVVFFTIAGASLELPALAATWPLALFLAVARMLLNCLGTGFGAFATRSPGNLVKYGWSGFVAQAGVTLGFAQLIEAQFPGFGESIKTVLLAMIAINQLTGPLLFKAGLYLSGEMENEEKTLESNSTGLKKD